MLHTHSKFKWAILIVINQDELLDCVINSDKKKNVFYMFLGVIFLNLVTSEPFTFSP